MASSPGSSRTEEASSSGSRRPEKEASSSSTPIVAELGKEVAVETRNWVDFLPHDVVVAILQKVGTMDILLNIQKVCVSWRKFCQDPALWRSIHMHDHGDVYVAPDDLVDMTMLAIDRSCGQLTDLIIEGFGDDDLLDYLTDRINQLKCLRIVSCLGISDEGLSEAAINLPSLEELHIYFGCITHVGLENVGLSCPGLKSLTYNQHGIVYVTELNDVYEEDGSDLSSEAFAISTSMPELRHLSLFGNRMSNRGLQAILDGCPHLESLDLRQCFRVNLPVDGELYKRCSSLKVFRAPYDSTDDYSFDSTVFHEREIFRYFQYCRSDDD